MGLFNNNGANTVVQMSKRDILEAKYRNSRLSLLMVVIFTAVNMLFLFFDATSYFLFSASVPYFLTYFGLFFGGKFPAEMYADIVPEGAEFVGYGNGIVVTLTVIAVLILAVYLLCWIFSKKQKVGWFIAALVMFSIDTLALLVFSFMGFSADSIFDIVFHVWVIFDLARGISACSKLKKLPVTEVTVEENAAACEVITDDVTPVDNAGAEVPAEIAENPAENSVEVSDDANFI